MNLDLVEPLRDLFKDEVRRVGAELGSRSGIRGPPSVPGPRPGGPHPGRGHRRAGGAAAGGRRDLHQELRAAGLYDSDGPGVRGPAAGADRRRDGRRRTYEHVVAIRAVETTDFMTADWARLPHEFLARVSSRIVNEVRGINRVVYDVTSKPPGTIEWE